MTAPSYYRLVKHVQLSVVESGAILLDTKRGRYWQLNVTSAKVVTLLITGSSVDDVVGALTEETDAPRTRIQADVLREIHSMMHAQLLRRVRQ